MQTYSVVQRKYFKHNGNIVPNTTLLPKDIISLLLSILKKISSSYNHSQFLQSMKNIWINLNHLYLWITHNSFFSEVFQEDTFTLFSVYFKTNTESFIGPDYQNHSEFFVKLIQVSFISWSLWEVRGWQPNYWSKSW